MNVSEIFEKKQRGDYRDAALMLKKMPDDIRHALNNPKSKNHQIVIQALEKIIKNREAIINESV